MKFLPTFMRNMLSTPAASDGIRIVSKVGGVLTLERRTGASMEMRSTSGGDGVQVSCELDGQRSKVIVKFPQEPNWEVSPGSEESCKDVYSSLMRDLSKNPMSWKRTAVLVVGAIIAIILFLPTGSEPISLASTESVASQPSVPPAAMVDSGGTTKGSTLDAAELLLVKGSKGIPMTKDGQPFYIFSDPNCPYCSELERSMSKLDPALQPTVLPLGFKPGSAEISASVLCSKDPASAWRKYLVEGIAPEGHACDTGVQQVRENMELFQALRLSSTPTMVSPNGLVVVGSGSPEKIAQVMMQ